MWKFLCVAGVAVDATAERSSTPYEAESHVPRLSSGCGKSLPKSYKTNAVSTHTGTYEGANRKWLVYLPKGYSQSSAHALVVAFHGYTASASAEENGDGIKAQASANNFVVVYPEGMADNTHSGSWGSWNCAGTVLSPGPAGATCTKSAGTQDYCFTSCGKCTDNPQCWWTTCHEDVTSTGIGTDLSGFIPDLYDALEADLCIDATREFATGLSNGGMMTYQVGASMGPRLAAIVPVAGSFHNGFNQAPQVGVPVMDIHGSKDTEVPANTSTSADGFHYTPLSQIFGGDSYSSGWKKANGCSGPISHYPTSLDGVSSLQCISEGTCSSGDVVRCSWNGGHGYYGYSAKNNGQLTWEFMRKWTKSSHIGAGCSIGEPCPMRLSKLVADRMPRFVVDAATPAATRLPVLTQETAGHYGDPDSAGCLGDEDVISVAGGRVCAPRIASEVTADGVREPACKFGAGIELPNNGCPRDANVAESSMAWPACVAKGNTSDPHTNGEFHCVLVCGPCSDADPESAECEDKAHQMCPEGAKCMLGELKMITMGICTYHSEFVSDSATSFVA